MKKYQIVNQKLGLNRSFNDYSQLINWLYEIDRIYLLKTVIITRSI